METGLRLLIRDGAVRVAFHPRLSLQHSWSSWSGPQRNWELRQAAEDSAKRWGMDLEFEDLGV